MGTIATISTTKTTHTGKGRIHDYSSHRILSKLYSGRYLTLDGVVDKVAIGNISESVIRTLVFWYRMPSGVAEQIVALNATMSLKGDANNISIGGTTGSVYLNGFDKTIQYANQWNKCIIVFDSNITMDAVEIGKIGADFGEIDISHWEFWSKAFTATDIFNVMSYPEQLASSFSNTALTYAHLIRFYRFVEGWGTTAYDSSGSDADATITGGDWGTQDADVPQTAFLGFNTVGGVMLPESADLSTPGVDIQGSALSWAYSRGMNFNGDGYLGSGNIGEVSSMIVAIVPKNSEQVVIDCDGTHKLGLTDTIATDFVIINAAGANVPVPMYAVNAAGDQVAISEDITLASAVAQAIGWEDETIFVNGVENGNFTIGALNIISIKSDTKFTASDFKTAVEYQGIIYEIACYRTSKTDVEDLINYRALNVAYGG
jgi:hypothetical protein